MTESLAAEEAPEAAVSESQQSGDGEGETPASTQINLQELAERVYRLLKKEARLERERLG